MSCWRLVMRTPWKWIGAIGGKSVDVFVEKTGKSLRVWGPEAGVVWVNGKVIENRKEGSSG
jgi:hypothetical protein